MTLFSAELFLKLSNVWVGRHSDTMFTLVEYDPYLGWRVKPNLNENVDLVDMEGIPVQTNSLGFWDKEFTREKDPSHCRIAFLGDSFAWGMGVHEEERFSNLIEAANPQWESLNFSIPGYGTDQSLGVWREFASLYQPDVAVLTAYQNDYVDNMYVVRYGRRKPYFELREDGELVEKGNPVDPTHFWHDGILNQAAPPYVQFFKEPVQKRSRIVHWLAKNSDLARFVYTRLRRKGLGEGRVSHSGLTPAQKKQVELLVALIIRLAEEVHSSNAELIVTIAGHLTPQHQAAMEALKEKGIPYLDITTEILEQQITLGKENVYYPYSKHWTPASHQAVAAVLSIFFQEKEICDSA